MTRQRFLLWCGVVGGPLFIAVFLVNDRIRAGYDPVRDFVSEAAIGAGGGLQIANFLVTGALAVAFGVAARRAVSPWTGALIAVFGLGLMVAGVFVSDPAPYVTARTAHGIIHDVASAFVFGSLTAAAFVAARWRPAARWRWYCRLVGVAVPVLFVLAGGVQAATGVFQRLAIAIGFTWLSVLALRALRWLSVDLPQPAGRPGGGLPRPAGRPGVNLPRPAGGPGVDLPRPADRPGVDPPEPVAPPDVDLSEPGLDGVEPTRS
ncbi:DUF998 domain-containing protein [Actinoplanes sp. CA-030573]|uniref:DUF998 domain-containing protein n=1 Tax=Actinoplanes sp. CA-030573 TaxID=3239898 RepID=UPI003D8B845C